MASILALLDDSALEKYGARIAAGAVLPIKALKTEDTSFAEALSRGGALYLVTDGDDGEIWLVAVLESPEASGIKRGDRRAPGWYAPANTTPVTDIKKLKSKLGIRGTLENALDPPVELAPEKEALLRELFGETDAPVLAPVEVRAAAPKLTGAPLERAVQYLAGAHVTAAIEAMKEAWRATRVPEIAALIDRATRVTPAYDRPLYDRSVLTVYRALYDQIRVDDNAGNWDAAFEADPISAMPQLLQNLAVGGYTFIPERAERLAALGEDPRLATRLVELIPSGPGRLNPDPAYWGPLVEIWGSALDLRTCSALLELEATIAGAKAKRMFDFARDPKGTLKKRYPVLAEADRPLLAAIERELLRLEEPTRLECDLVDAIAAQPDDVATKQIYADRLLERGHPRGEYIALSVQKADAKLTPALARRYAALEGLPFLYGPFDDLATRRTRPRDRGIDRDLQVSWNSMEHTWFEVAAHPLARALERLEFYGEPRSGRDEGIAAVARVATKLARIDGIGGRAGKTVAAMLDGRFKLVGDDLVRA